MQFVGKLSALDLRDAQKMTRPKTYWPKILLANWYGILLLLAIGWATISGFLGYTKPNWRAVAIIWVVIAAIIVWSVYRVKRGESRGLAQLNSRLPDQVTLTNDGVKMDGPNGATGFLPWRNFKGWREGRQVILLDQSQGNQVVILPIAQLSEIQHQQVRQFLQSQVPSVNH
jgi:hypothetical protein